MTLRLGASLLATMALALVAVTAGAAANPHTTYTCTKTKRNGQTDVRTSVSEAAVGGLTDAGFSCVVETGSGEEQGEDPGEQGEQPSDEQGEQPSDEQGEQPSDEQGEQPSDEQGEQPSDEQGEAQGEQGAGETPDEGAGHDPLPDVDPGPKADTYSPSGMNVEPPGESRSLFCSTTGPVERGNGDAPGIALNLPGTQGSLLVEQGVVTRAVFYEGIGVSCDLLPGFTYSGLWVDNVGEVVPGVAVYPYYVRATT